DRDRHVLKVLRTALRGDHDLLQATDFGGSCSRRLLGMGASRRSEQREAHGTANEQAPARMTSNGAATDVVPDALHGSPLTKGRCELWQSADTLVCKTGPESYAYGYLLENCHC